MLGEVDSRSTPTYIHVGKKFEPPMFQYFFYTQLVSLFYYIHYRQIRNKVVRCIHKSKKFILFHLFYKGWKENMKKILWSWELGNLNGNLITKHSYKRVVFNCAPSMFLDYAAIYLHYLQFSFLSGACSIYEQFPKRGTLFTNMFTTYNSLDLCHYLKANTIFR